MHVPINKKYWNSLSGRLPFIHRSTESLREWLFEYSLARFLGSAWVDEVIQHTQHLVLSSLLWHLRVWEDFFGLFKVFSPLFVFLGLRLAYAFMSYLKTYGRRNAVQFWRFLQSRFTRPAPP